MPTTFDIAEVARRTGLTLRALRFYEARRLVKPLRTDAGRRLYGEGELARLNAIVMLKRAGFSLAQIAGLLGGRPIDLPRLVAARIAAIEAHRTEIAAAHALLLTVQSRIDSGERIDVATLCSLIRTGDTMEQDWRAVTDRYLSDTAKADFAAAQTKMPVDFDQAAYGAQWAELGTRIEAALPLDPASPRAAAFHAEWQALLAPFTAVATPAMAEGVTKMYDGIDQWKGERSPPFSADVWTFIKAVGAVRSAA